MAQIFLSYAREDELRVRGVYHQLRAAGFDVWMDKINLLPGQRWQQEIPRAIRQSDFILLFFSSVSVAKHGYVQREFRLALDTLEEMPPDAIHTIPIRLDDCQIPEQFHHLQWSDLAEEGEFERIVRALHHGLQQRGQPLPAPVPHDLASAHPATALPSIVSSEPEGAPRDSPQQAAFAEETLVHLMPTWSLTAMLDSRQQEQRGESFSLVQEDHKLHAYTRQEVDKLTPTQRTKLFAADPEMVSWWRGKSLRSGTWPLFRLQGGRWISKEHIEQMPQENRGAFWDNPDLLDWYMHDRAF